MKIAVFGKRRQSVDDVPRIASLIRLLSDNGIFVAVQRHFYEAMTRDLGTPLDADDVFDADEFTADVAISIGGDGTFLRTARWVGSKEIPIIGFNTGHLGFLAEESLEDAPAIVENLLSGKFFIEPRSLLQVKASGEHLRQSITGWAYALNEVAILRHDSASMITIHTFLDDIEIASYQGDGLIIQPLPGRLPTICR